MMPATEASRTLKIIIISKNIITIRMIIITTEAPAITMIMCTSQMLTTKTTALISQATVMMPMMMLLSLLTTSRSSCKRTRQSPANKSPLRIGCLISGQIVRTPFISWWRWPEAKKFGHVRWPERSAIWGRHLAEAQKDHHFGQFISIYQQTEGKLH